MSRFKDLLLLATGIAIATLTIGLTNVRHSVAAADPKPQLVRDADNPAEEPFARFIPPGQTSLSVPTTTPGGRQVKRLVIEFVSAECQAGTGTSLLFVSLSTGLIQGNATSNTGYVFNPTQTFVDDGGRKSYAFGQQTRLYADPGTSIITGFGVAASGGAVFSCGMSLSGHFVTQ